MNTATLGSICSVRTGKKDVNQGNPSGKYPFFTCAKDHTYSDKYSFDGRAILIAGNGVVGQTTLYEGRFEAYQRTYVLMDFDERFDWMYLYYCIKSGFQVIANSNKLGNSMPYIKKGTVENFKIPVLSIIEQQRVVEELDVAFVKIDRAIELTGRNIKGIQMLYDSAFHSIIANAPGGEVILSDVCEINTKLVDPRERPYLSQFHVGAANIEKGTGKLFGLKTADEERLISSKFPFDEDTILYSKIRPYLMKVARPNFYGVCSADVYPLKVGDDLDKDYLFYLLLSPDFTQYAITGSQRAGMPKVNREHLFAYKFNLPNRSHQIEAVRKLDNLLKIKISAFDQYEKKLDYLLSLKQSLLNKYLVESDVK